MIVRSFFNFLTQRRFAPAAGALSVVALALLLASTAAAAQPAQDKPKEQDQEQKTKDTKPAAPPEEKKQDSKTKPPPLPSLDDLLGLPGSPKDKKPDASNPELDPDQLKLDRALDAQKISEMFEQAVAQMADAAKLMKDAHNVGVATQRVQEEIIIKLDKLIEEAENQQSSSSSSSSQQQQPQQQKSQQPQQPQDGQNQGNQGESKGARTPPGGQSAKLDARIDSLAAAWGALPTRLRDALMQGAGDTYSSLYESLTEAYYRRLAEQNKGPRQ